MQIKCSDFFLPVAQIWLDQFLPQLFYILLFIVSEHNALNIERKDLTAKSRMNTQPPLREQQVGHVAMRRILDTAPYLARCSDNKIALHIRPREYAIRRSYMQVNRPDMVSWLVFDLDHGNPNIWDDQDLPPPNFIVRDKHKNTAHLYYAIVSVCKSDKARVKPIRFMKRVYKTISKKKKKTTTNYENSKI